MNIAAALDLLIATLARAHAISEMIAVARAEDRDLGKAELDKLAAADDAAHDRLDAAIGQAKTAKG